MQKRPLAFTEGDYRWPCVWTAPLALGWFPALGKDWFRIAAVGMEVERRHCQYRRVSLLLRSRDLVGQLREQHLRILTARIEAN
jgi:hypothetical protein